MNDPKILSVGAEYVAKNYAWESAGYYWVNKEWAKTEKNMNRYVNQKSPSPRDVTIIVVGSADNSVSDRDKAYRNIYEILK